MVWVACSVPKWPRTAWLSLSLWALRHSWAFQRDTLFLNYELQWIYLSESKGRIMHTRCAQVKEYAKDVNCLINYKSQHKLMNKTGKAPGQYAYLKSVLRGHWVYGSFLFFLNVYLMWQFDNENYPLRLKIFFYVFQLERVSKWHFTSLILLLCSSKSEYGVKELNLQQCLKIIFFYLPNVYKSI